MKLFLDTNIFMEFIERRKQFDLYFYRVYVHIDFSV